MATTDQLNVNGLEVVEGHDSPEIIQQNIDNFLNLAEADIKEDIRNQGFCQLIVPLNAGLFYVDLLLDRFTDEEDIRIILASKNPIKSIVDLIRPIITNQGKVLDPSQWEDQRKAEIRKLLTLNSYSNESIDNFLNLEKLPQEDEYFLDGDLKPGVARIIDDIIDKGWSETKIKEAAKEQVKDLQIYTRACTMKPYAKTDYLETTAKIDGWVTAAYGMNGGIVNGKWGRLSTLIAVLERFANVAIRKIDAGASNDEFNSPISFINYRNFLYENSILGPRPISNPKFKVFFQLEEARTIEERFRIARNWLNRKRGEA